MLFGIYQDWVHQNPGDNLDGRTTEDSMQVVSEGEIGAIIQPTVIFTHTNELEIPEIADAKTGPTPNLQDNGAMPSVGIHIFS